MPFKLSGAWLYMIIDSNKKTGEKMKTRILNIVSLVPFVATSAYAQPETIKTRIGDLTFTHDFANG